MLTPSETGEIECFARPLVNGGYHDRDAVVEATLECYEEEFPEDELATVVDRVWRERLAEQADWPPETAAERLLTALRSLSSKGIVARENFTCCATCGAAEIGVEAHEGDRGYVFFHQQDTECAAMGCGLYLSYGSFDGTDPTVVGHEVVAALTGAGVATEWNGAASTRILVTPLEWRLRLP